MTGLFLRRLARDSSGVTIVEFAMIVPAFLMMLLGAFDMGFNMYTAAVLQGAIQDAARDSTVEGASTSTDSIDAQVRSAVLHVTPKATVSFARKAYSNYGDIGRPEDFTDVNGDGACDNGEPFEDVNGNGVWDSDRGTSGNGGARDAVLYEVTVNYPRAFPVAKLFGQSDRLTTVARTVLRNQPYALQGARAGTGTCT